MTRNRRKALPWGTLAGWSAALLGALPVCATPVTAQESVAELEATWYPTSRVARARGGPAAEARVAVYRGGVVLPLLLQGDRTLFVPRLSGSRVGITPAPIDPSEPVWVEALHDLDLELVLLRTLTERWRVALVVAPGVATDGRNVAREHLTMQGAALFTREGAAGGSWGVGASVTNSFGEVLAIPLVALQGGWGRTRVDLLLPARAEASWPLTERVVLGMRAGVDGNVYGLGREGTLQGGVVRYSVVDAGPTVDVALTTALHLALAGGVSLARRLEVEDGTGVRVEDAALRRGSHLRVGVSWRVTGEQGR